MLKNKWLLLASRLVLGALFIYASLDKVLNPLAFAQIIHNYRITPPSLINIAAVLLPWIELLAGLLLVIGIKVRGSNMTLGLLLLFYVVLLTVTASRGINVACGCFTTSMAVKSNLAIRIVEDLVMLLLSLHIFIFYKRSKQVEAI